MVCFSCVFQVDTKVSVKSREHSSQTLSCRDFYDGNFLASSVGEGRSLTNRGGQGLSLQNKCFQKIASCAGHLPKSCEILFLKVSFFCSCLPVFLDLLPVL